MLVFYLAFFTACGYHPPAPVEEHSTATKKHQLDFKGDYRVRSGDTLYAIAFNYDVDARNLAKWNGISSPYVIHPGQVLLLSPPPLSSRPAGSTSAVQISAAKSPGKTTTKTVAVPDQSTPVSSVSGNTKTATTGKLPVRNTADPDSWKWPTNGRVLRTYFAGDPARNGLDIAGVEGQAITATASGQVVYSGNGLIGYGELIIIKHSEKMLSAYAHNKRRLVKEGDQVSAGQKIAEMGRNAGNEQLLHFEIRARGKPVNPLAYLPEQ
jgi:lipoprotein NlpD